MTTTQIQPASEVLLSPSVTRGKSSISRWAGRLLFHVLLMSGALLVCIPFIWMITSSLKSPDHLFQVPIQWIPWEFRWQNYVEAWNSAPFARYFANSLFVCTVTTLLNLFFCSLTGYGFAKYSFPGKNILFVLILATLMIPFAVLVVPLFVLMRDLKWINTFNALIIPGMMSAFGIFLMRQFIVGLPNELFDAARIDGASEIDTYFHIVLPLSSGPLAALAVITFLDNWNSLLWPLIVISKDEMRTVAVGLTQFQSVHGTEYHKMIAAATLVVIPVLIVFFVLQRYFIRGIAFTGLKG